MQNITLSESPHPLYRGERISENDSCFLCYNHAFIMIRSEINGGKNKNKCVQNIMKYATNVEVHLYGIVSAKRDLMHTLLIFQYAQ